MSLPVPPLMPENRVLNTHFLPSFALYGDNQVPQAEDVSSNIGWELSPTPYWLDSKQMEQLTTLGQSLLQFLEGIDTLYKYSLGQTPFKGKRIPSWVASYFNQGKPEALIQFSQMKRFKNQLPLVIRPDLLITAHGFSLTEIDSVPGGLGFLSALNHAYRQSGFSPIENVSKDNPGNPQTLPEAFIQTLNAQVPEKENPNIAIVISKEASDYYAEWQWLVEHLQENHQNLYLLKPEQFDIVRDKLVAKLDDGQEIVIDGLYRFFELFDLPNIPKIELLQYAVKKRLVQCTPPFKPHLEEKMMFAFLHHPVLAWFWEQQLGSALFEQLRQMIPATWIMDPSPLPPQAVISGLQPSGQAIQDFESLSSLSQKGRELVIKPSGFSPLAWGSRGVSIGHDLSAEEWQARVQEALTSYDKTPYILQDYHNPKAHPVNRMSSSTGAIEAFQAKTRLCPYYLVQTDSVGHLTASLSGVLATACPSDKKIIHGMKDAVLAPCALLPTE